MDKLHVYNQFHISVDLGTLVPGVFLSRPNRFRAEVQLDSRRASAHLANPGRLTELLVPGSKVWLREAAGPHRKTSFDMVLVGHGDTLVSIDSHLPNALLRRALEAGRLPWVSADASTQCEVRLGKSRLDFLMQDRDQSRAWIEAKSVTLVDGQVARFPDAPTRRGRRHVLELAAAVARGDAAIVVFVVQREDAECFAPNDTTDPDFGVALREAAAGGVEVRAIRCAVASSRVSLDREIPVFLDDIPGRRYTPCHGADDGAVSRGN